MKTIQYLLLFICSLLWAPSGLGDEIDFATGTWVHPNGTSTNGWDSSQTTGTTTLPNGMVVSVSVTFAGGASGTSLNMTYIDESYFVGFAFQQQGAANGTTLSNYMRVDVSFSEEAQIDRFAINDIDFDEVVQVEGWVDTPGAPSTGIPANYSMGNNLQTHTFGGITGTQANSSENTTLDDQSNVGISFSTPVKGLSLYYWQPEENATEYSTIGIEGDFLVSAPPEPVQLYYTFDLTNKKAHATPVKFTNTLPDGLVWDPEYVEINGNVSGSPIKFSNDNKSVSSNNLVLHSGTNSLKLRTQETSLTGEITVEATLDPKHPQVPPIVQSTTITLPLP